MTISLGLEREVNWKTSQSQRVKHTQKRNARLLCKTLKSLRQIFIATLISSIIFIGVHSESFFMQKLPPRRNTTALKFLYFLEQPVAA